MGGKEVNQKNNHARKGYKVGTSRVKEDHPQKKKIVIVNLSRVRRHIGYGKTC